MLPTATVFAGAGQGLAFLTAMTEINRIAPPKRHAEIVSSFLVATYLGTGLPVIGVGLLAIDVGLLTAVQYFAAISAALCVTLLLTLASRNAPAAEAVVPGAPEDIRPRAG